MLLIDAGNSRIKWALATGAAWSRQGVTDHGAGALGLAFASLPPPGRIIVSNVAGAGAAQQIREACAAWAIPPEFIVARDEQCGVRNHYAQPALLGSDRWAALIAAWHQVRSACLVVNCGTATTVDALSDTGDFLGGLILPGLDMMRRSLVAGTAQLDMAEGNFQAFPRNTADAIFSGAVQASAGAIQQQYAALGKPQAICVLTGGAAGHIWPRLAPPTMRVDDLVLRGLFIIGQEELHGEV